jgi:hypothetical protein
MSQTLTLPSTLSQLLTSAVDALEAGEGHSKYKIDLDDFHAYSATEDVHYVGLAGALYASLFSFDSPKELPRVLETLLQQQLQLVEFVSRGMLDIAWVVLEPKSNPKFLEDKSFYKTLQEKDLYLKDPASYKQAIREFIVLITEAEQSHVAEEEVQQKSRKAVAEVA